MGKTATGGLLSLYFHPLPDRVLPDRDGMALRIRSASFIRQMAPSGNRNLPGRPHESMPSKRPSPKAVPAAVSMPGREGRAFREKTMRHFSFFGPGGPTLPSARRRLFRCRGARLGARYARLILRKPDRISRGNFSPADAFSAQRPSFRATSPLIRRKE